MSHNYTVDPAPLNITAYMRFLITRFIFFKEKNYFITAGKKYRYVHSGIELKIT